MSPSLRCKVHRGVQPRSEAARALQTCHERVAQPQFTPQRASDIACAACVSARAQRLCALCVKHEPIDSGALQTTCEGTAGSGGSRTSHAAPGWGRANPHRTGEVMRTVVMQRLVARTHPASPRQFNSDTKPQCPGSTPRQPVATAKYSTLGSKLEL